MGFDEAWLNGRVQILLTYYVLRTKDAIMHPSPFGLASDSPPPVRDPGHVDPYRDDFPAFNWALLRSGGSTLNDLNQQGDIPEERLLHTSSGEPITITLESPSPEFVPFELDLTPYARRGNMLDLDFTTRRSFSVFRSGEFSADAFGLGVWGDGGRTKKVQRTQQPVFNDQNNWNPQFQNQTTTEEADETIGYNRALGGGIGGNYFFTDYHGVGMEASLMRGGRHYSFNIGGHVNLRYPIEAYGIAPYAIAGIGGQFGDKNEFMVTAGLGIEKRFRPDFGLFSELRGSSNLDEINVMQARFGIRRIMASATTAQPMTRVRVPEGDSVMISGRAPAAVQVPGLSNVPLLSRLFRERTESRDGQGHVIILLTPRVMPEED